MVTFKHNLSQYCTGCLVSYKDVLTTAYCVQKTRKFQNNFKNIPTEAFINKRKYEIADTHAHPEFSLEKVSKTNIYNLGYVEVGIEQFSI